MSVKSLDRQWTVADRDMIVHKIVDGTGHSQHKPGGRDKISGFELDNGTNLAYPVGSHVASPGGPGIMAFMDADHPDARYYYWRVLKILAGSRIRYGRSHDWAPLRRYGPNNATEGIPMICAEWVIVLR